MSEKGFMFVEVLVAGAVIMIVLVLLLGIGGSVVNLSVGLQSETQATTLIREEMEAVRSFRDGSTWATNGLGALNTGSASPYYATLTAANPPAWQLNTGTQTVGNFTRKVVFDKVSRDPATGNIETLYNASHDDPDSRKATVTVTGNGRTYQVATYLTNWKSN